jgi:hypothetical protein
MIKSALIGCGNIASLLDTKQDYSIITHANAYEKNPQTQLILCADPNSKNLDQCKKEWGRDIINMSSNNLLEQDIDCLSICSPTPLHSNHLSKALQNPYIEYIICEKPLVETKEDYEKIEYALLNTNKKVIINYVRRFDPSFIQLKSILAQKEFGDIISFNGIFTKGLYHNGSHMLDLIELIIGDIQSIKVDQKEIKNNDIYGIFSIQTVSAFGILQNINNINYSLFELDIILENARVKISDSGHCIKIYKKVKSDQYKGYFKLELFKTLPNTLQFYAKNSLDFLLKKTTKETLRQQVVFSKKLLDIKSKFLTENTNIYRQ